MRRKRKRQRPEKQVKPRKVDLDEMIATFGQACGYWESLTVTGPLVRARLADHCRDAGMRPVPETAFESRWSGYDEEHRQRFAVLISACEFEAIAERIPEECTDDATPVLDRFQELTERLKLLTLTVLQQSDVRLEEFSRHFCDQWKVGIAGETKAASAKRLHDIDFSRLIQEAEQARSSAEDRLEYLRQLQQQEEETRRPRRGKW